MIASKPQVWAESMDGDPNIRTRQVNYINRPNFENGKRRPNNILPIVDKRQRNFDIKRNVNKMTDYQQTLVSYEVTRRKPRMI